MDSATITSSSVASRAISVSPVCAEYFCRKCTLEVACCVSRACVAVSANVLQALQIWNCVRCRYMRADQSISQPRFSLVHMLALARALPPQPCQLDVALSENEHALSSQRSHSFYSIPMIPRGYRGAYCELDYIIAMHALDFSTPPHDRAAFGYRSIKKQGDGIVTEID